MADLFKNKYRVKSTRLRGWNYLNEGYYFVTICAGNRELFFGDVIDSKMALNDIGKIVDESWREIPNHFDNAKLDEFIVMPNHLHGIIRIVYKHGCTDEALPRLYTGDCPQMSNISPKTGSLSVIIGSLKSICTRTINQKYPDLYFTWQPRFHDRIIRNEKELFNVRQYIFENPERWEADRNNPNNFNKF